MLPEHCYIGTPEFSLVFSCYASHVVQFALACLDKNCKHMIFFLQKNFTYKLQASKIEETYVTKNREATGEC